MLIRARVSPDSQKNLNTLKMFNRKTVLKIVLILILIVFGVNGIFGSSLFFLSFGHILRNLTI